MKVTEKYKFTKYKKHITVSYSTEETMAQVFSCEFFKNPFFIEPGECFWQ